MVFNGSRGGGAERSRNAPKLGGLELKFAPTFLGLLKVENAVSEWSIIDEE